MLLSLVFLFSLCLHPNFIEANDPTLECLEIEDVDMDDAFEFITKNVSLAESIPNLKCYAACCLEGMNALDGCTLQPEHAKKYVTDNGLRKDMLSAYDACHNSTVSEERCQCGYEIYKCIMEYMEFDRS